MLTWKSQGLIYEQHQSDHFSSHATRPIPILLNDETLRIYFSSRNQDNCPLPNYIDVSALPPFQILHVNHSPLLSLGKLGCFDDSGVTITGIADSELGRAAFYSGWKRRRYKGITIESSIGVAWFDVNNLLFRPDWDGPILSINPKDPYFLASPFVLREGDSDYSMYYCSADQWIDVGEDDLQMTYLIYRIKSTDGLNWDMSTRTLCLERGFDGEVLSTPWISKCEGTYHMFYSSRDVIRPRAYQPKYATSLDGIKWTKQDTFKIAPSGEDWDSKMIAYPSLYLTPCGGKFLFYSGNDVGRGGIGYATLIN